MRRKELLTLLDAYIAENFTGEEIVAKSFSAAESFSVAEDIFYEKIPKPKPVTQARHKRRESRSESSSRMLGFMVPAFLTDDIDKVLAEESNETFSEMLVRLIKESGKKPSEIYKRADVQRRIFQRIKDNKNYQPSKDTVVAFAIALKLDLPTTKKFLETAGFALSNAVKRDVIISCFIENKIFSVIKLNEILHEYGQNVLFKRE